MITNSFEAKKIFIFKQLLEVCLILEYPNEIERGDLSTNLRNLLVHPSINEEFQKLILKVLNRIHNEETDFLQVVLEIVSDILEPLDPNKNNNENNDDNDNNNEDEEMNENNNVNNEEEKGKEKLNNEKLKKKKRNSLIEEENFDATDPNQTLPLLLKASPLCEEILLSTSDINSHPGLSGLLDSIIYPSIQHPELSLREKGFKNLALHCLLDPNEASELLLLFVQAVQKDAPSIQLIAAQSLFDFLTLFDPISILQSEENWPKELIDSPPKNKPNNNKNNNNNNNNNNNETNKREEKIIICNKEVKSKTISVLVSLLRHPSTEVRTIAVQGFSKLLLNNYITDPNIFAVMVLLYFHPATEGNTLVTQCLNVFFPAFSMNSSHKKIIEKSFYLSVHRILSATKYSPLRKIQLDIAVQFILKLFNMKSNSQQIEEKNNNNNNSNNNNDNNNSGNNDCMDHDHMLIGLLRELIENAPNYLVPFSKNFIKIISSEMKLSGKFIEKEIYHHITSENSKNNNKSDNDDESDSEKEEVENSFEEIARLFSRLQRRYHASKDINSVKVIDELIKKLPISIRKTFYSISSDEISSQAPKKRKSKSNSSSQSPTKKRKLKEEEDEESEEEEESDEESEEEVEKKRGRKSKSPPKTKGKSKSKSTSPVKKKNSSSTQSKSTKSKSKSKSPIKSKEKKNTKEKEISSTAKPPKKRDRKRSPSSSPSPKRRKLKDKKEEKEEKKKSNEKKNTKLIKPISSESIFLIYLFKFFKNILFRQSTKN